MTGCNLGNMTQTQQSPQVDPTNPLNVAAPQPAPRVQYRVHLTATVEAWTDGASLADAVAQVEDRIEKSIPGGTVQVLKGSAELFRV